MDGSQERTEKATPKRRERARAAGDVARSAAAGAVLSVCFAVLPVGVASSFARWWVGAFARCATTAVEAAHSIDAAPEAVVGRSMLIAAAPWVAVGAGWLTAACAAVGAAAVCGAVGWSPGALRVRLRPAAFGFATQLLRPDNAIAAGIGLAAACAVIASATFACALLLDSASVRLTLRQEPALLADVLTSLWRACVAALVPIAALDVVLARRRHAARMRMTPREVRDERAEHEGRPEVKARRRSVSLRRGRGLRIAALKRATAVVTNPTHVAVVLRYAPPEIDVPIVLTSGANVAAAALRAAAEVLGVPVIESPDLARALFNRVDVDEAIPEELYAAVAAVFALILRTRGALRGSDPE